MVHFSHGVGQGVVTVVVPVVGQQSVEHGTVTVDSTMNSGQKTGSVSGGHSSLGQPPPVCACQPLPPGPSAGEHLLGVAWVVYE